eukprot:198983-Prorocentrum_minimum.AAC.1
MPVAGANRGFSALGLVAPLLRRVTPAPRHDALNDRRVGQITTRSFSRPPPVLPVPARVCPTPRCPYRSHRRYVWRGLPTGA